MATPKQTEINRRRQLVSKLRHEGIRSQRIIADRLRDDYGINVTQQTVSNDFKALNRLWRQSGLNNTDAYLKEMERQYRQIFQQSMIAWEQSLEDKEIINQEGIKSGMDDNGSGMDGSRRVKIQKKTEGQSGNPAHLRNAMSALEAIREMYGLDQPEQIEHKIDDASLTDEDRANRIFAILDRARKRGNRSPHNGD